MIFKGKLSQKIRLNGRLKNGSPNFISIFSYNTSLLNPLETPINFIKSSIGRKRMNLQTEFWFVVLVSRSILYLENWYLLLKRLSWIKTNQSLYQSGERSVVFQNENLMWFLLSSVLQSNPNSSDVAMRS